MRKLISVSIISALLLAACSTVSAPRISVSPPSYDFGDIAQSEGPVSTVFTVQNIGGKELVINRLSTSCGCTTAGMDQSPLPPDASRNMTVTFDPMVHPDQLGAIQRVVYLQTSDPIQPETEINLTGNVIQ